MSAWQAVVTDPASRERAFLAFEGLKVTRRLNRHSSGSFAVEAEVEGVHELQVASRVVKVYEDGALRLHGRIRDPLRRSSGTVQVELADPFSIPLGYRFRASRFVRTNTDASTIASDLLAAENARAPTGLRMGAVAASVRRDRTYEKGKNVAEAIEQLAGVDGGFFFVVNPVDGVAGVYAELVVRWPTSGSDRSGVKFEYGDGTLGNLDDYVLVEQLPRTQVTATGATEGEQQLSQTHTWQAGVSEFGLLEGIVSFPDVSEAATLLQHAIEETDTKVPTTYSLTPAESGEGTNESHVPRLFVDFDVGDVVRATIRHGSVDVTEVPVRVTEATVEVANEHAGSRLTGLVVETLG